MTIYKSHNTRKLVLLALLTAFVVVLQYLGAFIRFGPFSVSLVLMPIAIGAALVSRLAGGWLGLVFGLVVLVSGDANVFLMLDPVKTVIVVILKGMLAGLAAGGAYKLFSGVNRTIGAVAAAIVCPTVNTGIFIIGAALFFMPTITEWGLAAGFTNVAAFLFLGLAGPNFLFELGLNVILSPAIIRLVQYGQDNFNSRKPGL